VQCYKS